MDGVPNEMAGEPPVTENGEVPLALGEPAGGAAGEPKENADVPLDGVEGAAGGFAVVVVEVEEPKEKAAGAGEEVEGATVGEANPAVDDEAAPDTDAPPNEKGEDGVVAVVVDVFAAGDPKLKAEVPVAGWVVVVVLEGGWFCPAPKVKVEEGGVDGVFVVDPNVNVELGVPMSEFERRKAVPPKVLDGVCVLSVKVRRNEELGELGAVVLDPILGLPGRLDVEEAPVPKTNTLPEAVGEEGAAAPPNVGIEGLDGGCAVPKPAGEPMGLEGALPPKPND